MAQASRAAQGPGGARRRRRPLTLEVERAGRPDPPGSPGRRHAQQGSESASSRTGGPPPDCAEALKAPGLPGRRYATSGTENTSYGGSLPIVPMAGGMTLDPTAIERFILVYILHRFVSTAGSRRPAGPSRMACATRPGADLSVFPPFFDSEATAIQGVRRCDRRRDLLRNTDR